MPAPNPAIWQALQRKRMNEARIKSLILNNSANARWRLQQGAYSEALKLCQQVLSIDPDHPTFNRLATLVRYKIYLHQGKFAQASTLYAQYQDVPDPLEKTERTHNPFVMVKLMRLSPVRVESIQLIEKHLECLVLHEQKLLQQSRLYPNALSGHLKQFHTAALDCYNEIKSVQATIALRLKRFVNHPPKICSNASPIANRKVLWMHLDEMLFLLEKYRMVGDYFTILQSKINRNRSVPKFQQHGALQSLAKQCQQSSENHPAIIWNEALQSIQVQMSVFRDSSSGAAYQHLRRRLNHVLQCQPESGNRPAVAENAPAFRVSSSMAALHHRAVVQCASSASYPVAKQLLGRFS